MLTPVIGTPLSIADNTALGRSSATFSWSGGTPTISGSGVDPYDNGFSHTNALTASYYATYETLTFVPGDTKLHTVHLYGYLTGNNSGISLQFSNSVAGASPVLYTNAGTALTTAGFDYSVQFQADNPGDALTVVFTYQKTGGTATAKRMGINAAAITAYVPPTLSWQGNVNPNWDIAMTANWTNSSGAAVNYTETGGVGDSSATFDDTGVSYLVNVTTAVHPLAILVNNTANNYVLSNSPSASLGGSGGLTKQGSGVLTLVGTGNSFSNGVTLSGGTLRLGASESIPDGAGMGNLTIGTNTTLDLNGYNETINGFSNPFGGGTVDNVAGGGTSTLTVGNNNASSTFSGTIQNSSGIVALSKTGTGSLSLSGANTFAGGITLNAGQLNLNSPGALGTGPLTIAASGVLLNNNGGAVVTLNTTNAQNWNGDFTFTGTRNLNFGPGSVTMNASRTVTVNANSLAVGGPIAGGGFGLTKNGAGTLQINYSNTFNGPILVNAGLLQLSTAHQGGGAVTLAANANLQVNSGLPGATLNASALTFGTTSGNTNVLTLNFGTNTNPATALITAGGVVGSQ
jgi:autotransporter-associated beta strand protein